MENASTNGSSWNLKQILPQLQNFGFENCEQLTTGLLVSLLSMGKTQKSRLFLPVRTNQRVPQDRDPQSIHSLSYCLEQLCLQLFGTNLQTAICTLRGYQDDSVGECLESLFVKNRLAGVPSGSLQSISTGATLLSPRAAHAMMGNSGSSVSPPMQSPVDGGDAIMKRALSQTAIDSSAGHHHVASQSQTHTNNSNEKKHKAGATSPVKTGSQNLLHPGYFSRRIANIVVVELMNATDASIWDMFEQILVHGQFADPSPNGGIVSLPSPFLFILLAPESLLDSIPRSILNRMIYHVPLQHPLPSHRGQPLKKQPLLSLTEIPLLHKQVESIFVSPSLRFYMQNLLSNIRQHPDIFAGVSTQACYEFILASKAISVLLDPNTSFLGPDSCSVMFQPCVAHRLRVTSRKASKLKDNQQLMEFINQCLVEILQTTEKNF